MDVKFKIGDSNQFVETHDYRHYTIIMPGIAKVVVQDTDFNRVRQEKSGANLKYGRKGRSRKSNAI